MITRTIANLAMILTVGAAVVLISRIWIVPFFPRFILALLAMSLLGWPFRPKQPE